MAHANLKKFFKDQNLLKLTATVVTNLLKNENEQVQQKFQECLRSASTLELYARCAEPIIVRHRSSANFKQSVKINLLTGYAVLALYLPIPI